MPIRTQAGSPRSQEHKLVRAQGKGGLRSSTGSASVTYRKVPSCATTNSKINLIVIIFHIIIIIIYNSYY